MIRHINQFCIALMISAQVTSSAVRIRQIQGDIRIRRGLEEDWISAGIGMNLKPMDTIFSGEASKVVLELDDQSIFTLGSNAVLDVSDLRRITERQLFLYLMSKKVETLDVPESTEKIHITNVSVVRGTKKEIKPIDDSSIKKSDWSLEANGARALLAAEYYTNAIMKFYKILERYPSLVDHGEIHFHLGQAFEALKKPGRACDAYRTALKQIEDSDTSQKLINRKKKIQAALDRLMSDS
ncbi:tetratricopeptide repeat protein [bacterium]|nr:tetratricopeptide repeat protein [bacterium]